MAKIIKVEYRNDKKITVDEFVDLLNRSTLAQRRPVNDPDRIGKMLQYGNILITAWLGDHLVGVSRALSDFAFCCYLSDLAVDEKHQHQGIGKRLIEETHRMAGEKVQLTLLAAPAAVNYYAKVGMERFEHCYIIKRKK